MSTPLFRPRGPAGPPANLPASEHRPSDAGQPPLSRAQRGGGRETAETLPTTMAPNKCHIDRVLPHRQHTRRECRHTGRSLHCTVCRAFVPGEIFPKGRVCVRATAPSRRKEGELVHLQARGQRNPPTGPGTHAPTYRILATADRVGWMGTRFVRPHPPPSPQSAIHHTTAHHSITHPHHSLTRPPISRPRVSWTNHPSRPPPQNEFLAHCTTGHFISLISERKEFGCKYSINSSTWM